MTRQLGDEYAAFAATYHREAAKGLRVNRRFVSDETLLSALGCEFAPIPYQAGGYRYRGELGKHSLHHAGAYYLQDPSAMLVANAYDFPCGAMVLDLCAAPGGKSTAIAQMIGEEGRLVANEIDLGRAKTLMGNVERMGLTNVLVTSLTPDKAADTFGAIFDVVVVDAPCSGEGMFRKNPLAVDEWSEDNVRMCAERQRRILDCAARCVKEGGRLLYSTCTFAEEENEESVRYLLDSGDFVGETPTARVLAATTYLAYPFARRFYPHLGEGEGHFVAVLRRVSPTPVPPKIAPPKRLGGAEARAVESFLREVALAPIRAEACCVGGQVCLVPDGMPIPPYGVLSAGVKVGEVTTGRKGLRVEPHHMVFKCLPLRNGLDLALDDDRLMRYLHGETVLADVADGWGVLRVLGCPLGGYKAVDGVLKNHYPKGLRTT